MDSNKNRIYVSKYIVWVLEMCYNVFIGKLREVSIWDVRFYVRTVVVF